MKVLIIRSGALGDTLMLMPAIAQLREKAHITLVGRSPGIDYLGPHLDGCMDFENSRWHALFLDPFEGGFPPVSGMDVAVAFSADSEGILQKNLHALFPGAAHAFRPFPAKNSRLHVALYLAQCLQEAGLPLDAAAAIEAAQKHPLLASPETQEGQKMHIVFHPGSGSAKKNYSPAFWTALLTVLQKELQLQPGTFSLLLGPAEEQARATYKDLAKERNLEVISSPRKEALTALLSKASLYIGLDSGISHLAAMCGTPTIALFKSTSMYQWRPIGPMVSVLKARDGNATLVGRVLREAGILLNPNPNAF